MADGRLAEAVRYQVGLGRIVPLGGASDGAWITESAAVRVLRPVAESVEGVRVRALRVGPVEEAEPEAATPEEEAVAGDVPAQEAPAGEGAGAGAEVPAPAGAVPAGPLRVSAALDVAFGALTRVPLPELAERVRRAVLLACDDLLGLEVAAVDIEVADLPDEVPPPAEDGGDDEGSGEGGEGREGAAPAGSGDDAAHRAARAALTVPGAAGLDPGLGGLLASAVPGVRVDGSHVLLHLAVAAGYRPLTVARAVRRGVAAAVPSAATVAVLVTRTGAGRAAAPAS